MLIYTMFLTIPCGPQFYRNRITVVVKRYFLWKGLNKMWNLHLRKSKDLPSNSLTRKGTVFTCFRNTRAPTAHPPTQTRTLYFPEKIICMGQPQSLLTHFKHPFDEEVVLPCSKTRHVKGLYHRDIQGCVGVFCWLRTFVVRLLQTPLSDMFALFQATRWHIKFLPSEFPCVNSVVGRNSPLSTELTIPFRPV